MVIRAPHIVYDRSAGRGGCVRHSRCAFTILEMLMAVAISSLVMMATLTLLSAYGYSSTQLQDLQPLRTEAASLHSYIQDWLRRAKYVYDPICQPVSCVWDTTPRIPRIDEAGKVWIYAYVGERPGRAYNGKQQYDELECLEWNYVWDTSGGVFSGELRRYYFASGNDDDTPITPVDLISPGLVWLGAADDVELLSSNVYRFEAESFPASGVPESYIDIKVTLLNFSRVNGEPSAPNGLFVPSKYTFNVAGGPDTYSMPE